MNFWQLIDHHPNLIQDVLFGIAFIVLAAGLFGFRLISFTTNHIHNHPETVEPEGDEE